MLEEFISVALEAFINANGDVDKFELQLRRKLMAYNTSITQQKPNSIVPPLAITQVEKAITSLNDTDPIFTELENLDVSSMSDEDIIEFARRLGVIGSTEETQLKENE
jgi:hypothetical protein